MHSGFQQPYLSMSPSQIARNENLFLATVHNSTNNDGSYSSRPEKPSLSSSSLYPPSTNRLIPSKITLNGSTSTSPTSTCSSPTPYLVTDTLPGPSSTNLTPPQSAPPQKVADEFFPRTRSRSPGEMSGFYSPGGFNAKAYKRQSVGDWEIGSKEIQFGPKIGSGSFGTVFKGTYFGN